MEKSHAHFHGHVRPWCCEVDMAKKRCSKKREDSLICEQFHLKKGACVLREVEGQHPNDAGFVTLPQKALPWE